MTLGIVKLEEKELKKIVSKLSKRTVSWRDLVSTEQDWWKLYTLAAMCGKVRDERLTEITGYRRNDAGSLVFNLFFTELGYLSFYDMPRGKRQSFTYKMKRLEEKLNSFARNEVHGGYRWESVKSLKEEFGIKTLYVVQVSHNNVGVVFGVNEQHARQMADMFVVPMVPKSISERGRGQVSLARKFEVWPSREMEDYVLACNEITEKIRKTNNDHQNRIDQISSEIKDNELIINSLRSNLMVQLDVEKR